MKVHGYENTHWNVFCELMVCHISTSFIIISKGLTLGETDKGTNWAYLEEYAQLL